MDDSIENNKNMQTKHHSSSLQSLKHSSPLLNDLMLVQ